MSDVGRAASVSRRRFLASAGAASAGLVIAGCSALTKDEEEGLSGDIRISGSSTVYPITTAISERFQARHPDVSFDISRDGSSGGFENVFVPGDADINNASRPITQEEIDGCEANGFEPVEFRIAQDALTVVVNNENDWIEGGLTYDDLAAIWTPDDPPELWSDVDDSWPDEPFDLYGPASTSGTFDYFTETILGEAGRIRDDFEGGEEDDQIASGVEGSRYALGYMPFAYYTNNPDETRAIPLAESGDGYVEPGLDAASTGEYPLARPLFFYANSEKLERKRHLQRFVRFYIDQSGDRELIAEHIGYVPSSEEQQTENENTLAEYAGELEDGTTDDH